VTVGHADRKEFMESEDDFRVGQNSPRERDEVDAEGEEMVEMYNVWPHILEELRVALHQQRLRNAVPHVIVAAREKQEFVVFAVEPCDPRAALEEGGIAPIGGAQQHGANVLAGLKALKKLVTDLLRPTSNEFGMEQAYEQYRTVRAIAPRRRIPPGVDRGGICSERAITRHWCSWSRRLMVELEWESRP
jgi:hypothetical protein